MNRYLEERLEGIRKVLMEQHKAGGLISSASKGLEREIFIREFLARVFPPSIRFGTGDITDSKGKVSGQVDVVVELPLHPSFPLAAGGAVRFYLAEGVAAVLEIKSDLAKQWDQVESTVQKLKRLKRVYNSIMAPYIPVFAVGYTGYKKVEMLRQRLKTTEGSSCPDGALVLEDPGVFVYRSPHRPHREALGGQALYGLITEISVECTRLEFQRPNFGAYQ